MRSHRPFAVVAASLRGVGAAIIVASLLTGCASTPPATLRPTASPAVAAPRPGGTLRVVVPADGFTVALRDASPLLLDPQLDGWGTGAFSGSRELARCCLARTLFSHNGRSTSEGGSRVAPDLAMELPDVSPDGLTWTIRIRQGIHYGSPLEKVEITAADFIRSFHRLLAPAFAATGPWYWDFIEIAGAATYNAGTAARISGLEAPDEHTLVIRLSAPAGDLAARLAEPSTVPLPADPTHPDALFGIAEGADAGAGRSWVSSGPYMVDGSDRLDLSVPAAQRATPSGIGPGRITLVRNPSWDRATDHLRPAFADRIEVRLVANAAAAVAELDAGRADLVWPAAGPSPSIPATVVDALKATPSRGRAAVDTAAAIRTIDMNLAQPPFDDIRVRKAVNLVVDKQALVGVQGGPIAVGAFGHMAADTLEDGLNIGYAPYATPGDAGDLAAARAEMVGSAYDADGDGRCDRPACAHLRAITRQPYVAVAKSVAADLERLGIHLDVEALDPGPFFAAAGDPRQHIAMVIGIGFFSAYIGAQGLFTGFAASPDEDSRDTNLVGATPEQLRRWGYTARTVPGVDERYRACVPLIGAAGFSCWAALDAYLMEQVVPWVPYSQDRYVALVGPRVLSYAFDELISTTSLDQLALAQ